jgi:hypothetical protein
METIAVVISTKIRATQAADVDITDYKRRHAVKKETEVVYE